MKPPTLGDLIQRYRENDNSFPLNAWVHHPWFELYARIGPRNVDGVIRECIQLANIRANTPGQGDFTRLVHSLREQYPEYGVFVENVTNARFDNKLLQLGFQVVNAGETGELKCYMFLGNTPGSLRVKDFSEDFSEYDYTVSHEDNITRYRFRNKVSREEAKKALAKFYGGND